MDYSKCDECRKDQHFSQIRMNCSKGTMGWSCAPMRYKRKMLRRNDVNNRTQVDFLKLLKGDPQLFANLTQNLNKSNGMNDEVNLLRSEGNDMRNMIAELTAKLDALASKKKPKEDNHAY